MTIRISFWERDIKENNQRLLFVFTLKDICAWKVNHLFFKCGKCISVTPELIEDFGIFHPHNFPAILF